MMSLSAREEQVLTSLEDGLALADPRLASLLTIFGRLTSGEEMPAREKIPAVRRRDPRRGLRYSCPGRQVPSAAHPSAATRRQG